MRRTNKWKERELKEEETVWREKSRGSAKRKSVEKAVIYIYIKRNQLNKEPNYNYTHT